MAEVENLNSQEKEAIEELQIRMKTLLPPDMQDDTFLLYRFLKARDFNVNKAESMLRKSIQWRKVYQISTYLEDFKPAPVFLKYISPSYLGQDKEGNLVYYSAAGKIDTRDVLKCFKLNDYLRHWIWTVERNLAQIKEINQKKTGKTASKFSYILDLNGFEFANAAHPTTATIYMQIAELYQDNYPERLKAFYLINAPAYYVIAYSIIKRILAQEVVRKIHVYGRSGWKEDIFKMLDADILPAFLGGYRTDPDGNIMCNTFVCHCGKIPSNYYLSKEDRSFKDTSRVKHIAISPGTNYEISADIRECGSIILWEYDVRHKDIGFGLYFKESDELKEILPVHRFETSGGTETGSYKCEWTGTYVIIFDNTFSWVNTKEISYCITVTKAEG